MNKPATTPDKPRSKLVSIYLDSASNNGVEEHLADYLSEGYSISDIHSAGVAQKATGSVAGWVIVRLSLISPSPTR